MELDDLKTAWQALDRRLADDRARALEARRDRRLDRAHSTLRSLARGQGLQLAGGVVLEVCAAAFWNRHRSPLHLFAAGMMMQVYGLALIVCAGRTLSLIQQIDYAAPVVTIQRRLARLRQWYVRSGLTLGLVWWLLWIPGVMMLFMSAFGADLYVNAPSMIWGSTAVGLAGLLLTWGGYRWAQGPGRSAVARAIADSAAGRSIVRAQAEVDDVARFERE